MKVRDRLSGRTQDLPPSPALNGRWVVELDEGDTIAHLNGVQVEHGDTIVPNPTGQWVLVRDGDTAPVRGEIFPDYSPNPQDVDAIEQIGVILSKHRAEARGWLSWVDESPIAPGLDESIKRHPLEDDIERELPHLAEVCHHPRTHIKLEVERVHTSRARRIAREAPRWLSAHTEDWHHRTIRGVQPRRILAEVREEQWDIYENRVAARLIDHLVAWLRDRVFKVRRLIDEVYSVVAGGVGAERSSRHRLDRICRVWGESWDDTSKRDIAEATLRQLEKLLYQVLGLMDTPLYRNVPKKASVPRTLRRTNLLGNDDGYRGVARLWRAWSQHTTSTRVSPKRAYERAQALVRSFESWCVLLVIRACNQLEIRPKTEAGWETELRPGVCIELEGELTFKWDEVGGIYLTEGDRQLIRFFPLVQSIEGARTRAALNKRARPIVQDLSEGGCWTIVLHPSSPGQAPYPEIAGVPDPPAFTVNNPVDFMRVSPISIDSVERVARAIRWATLAPKLLSYPPQCTPVDEMKHLLKHGMEKRPKHAWAMTEPLNDGSQLTRIVHKDLKEAEAHLQDLESNKGKIEQELKGAKDDRRKTAELNRKKRFHLEPKKEAEDRVKALARLEREIDACKDILDEISSCPVCGQPRSKFAARSGGCFIAECTSKSCKAVWGLVQNEEGGEKIPFLDRPEIPLPSPRRSDKLHEVDSVLGCDVLSIPYDDEGGTRRYRPLRHERTQLFNSANGETP